MKLSLLFLLSFFCFLPLLQSAAVSIAIAPSGEEMKSTQKKKKFARWWGKRKIQLVKSVQRFKKWVSRSLAKRTNGKIRIGLLVLLVGILAFLSSQWIGLSILRLAGVGLSLIGLVLLILGFMDS